MHGKPAVASLGAAAALAAITSRRPDGDYVNPGTLHVSRRDPRQMANFEQAMKKVGVDLTVAGPKAGSSRTSVTPAAPCPPTSGACCRRCSTTCTAMFIGAVAAGRKLNRDDVVRFADGRVFSGMQAKDLKMVDALGGFDEPRRAGAGKLAGLPSPPAVIQPNRRVLHHGPAAQSVRRQRRRGAASALAARVQDPPLFDGLRGPRGPGQPVRPAGQPLSRR